MSDLSKAVQDANATLQADASAAAATKKFGAAATAWVLAQDPVITPPPPPPVLAVTQSIKDGDLITGPVDWTATPNATVTEVDFYIDAALKQIDVTPPYSYTLDPANLADGSHTFTVRALDSTGKTATSDVTATTKKPVPPPPPSPSSAIPVVGACPGHSSQVWTDATHAGVMTKMTEWRNGHACAWRVDWSGVNAKTDRDIVGAWGAGMTPYLVVGGTTGPRVGAPTWLASAVQHVEQLRDQWASSHGGVRPPVIYTGPNEPDLNGWDATTLANYQVAIYKVIKPLAPDCLVLYAAIWKGTPNAFANWTPYIDKACAIAKGYFDGYPGHFYDDPLQATAANTTWNCWTWWFDKFGQHVGQTAEAIFRKYGVTVPIVNDESGGQNADPVFTQKCVRLLDQAKQKVCAMTVIYCVLPDVPGYNHLLNPDLSKLPSFDPTRDFIGGI